MAYDREPFFTVFHASGANSFFLSEISSMHISTTLETDKIIVVLRKNGTTATINLCARDMEAGRELVALLGNEREKMREDAPRFANRGHRVARFNFEQNGWELVTPVWTEKPEQSKPAE